MKKVILILLTLATIVFANECRYDAKTLHVTWEAYKTPLKIGVGGTFDNISIKAADTKSEKSFLKTSTVIIDTSSINSKNKGRDAKLVKYFFAVQGVKNITAKVVSLSDKIINIDITMNGVTKNIPMKLNTSDKIEAQGYIDLADFNMLPSLAGINKACFSKHKGKTWQDVTIKFELQTHKNCK
ncbi:YceI family protein [Sulfurimonas autotrophica]|uniref:YceI family protein n=1 Tax=Sulfurimonas autotrophica (strain ATCC BAA-671 / DSM 16294 / JCM 11897 / OK10) TaxID=563040 RepID=E0UQ30_SULAO|nr:YceI family protein [Sulfurimonas autotrophica]ADN08705.1 YceI family protein [Sulfurimonas autotrophica DSM 16294]